MSLPDALLKYRSQHKGRGQDRGRDRTEDRPDLLLTAATETKLDVSSSVWVALGVLFLLLSSFVCVLWTGHLIHFVFIWSSSVAEEEGLSFWHLWVFVPVVSCSYRCCSGYLGLLSFVAKGNMDIFLSQQLQGYLGSHVIQYKVTREGSEYGEQNLWPDSECISHVVLWSSVISNCTIACSVLVTAEWLVEDIQKEMWLLYYCYYYSRWKSLNERLLCFCGDLLGIECCCDVSLGALYTHVAL